MSQVAIHGVKTGQIIHGTVTVTVDSLPSNLNVWRVEISVSDTVRSGSYGSPYVLTLDTRNIPQGPDTLVINILLAHDSTLGLLNGLIQATSNDMRFSVSIPVVVNNNIPAGLQNVSCVWTDNPVLTWSSSQDQNFSGYIIRRYWPGSMTDTIFDRATTTFTDYSIQPVYGDCAGYSLSAWNGYNESTIDSVYILYGDTLSESGLPGLLAASPNKDELYLSTATGSNQVSLWSFSTLTNQLTQSLPALGNATHLSLSADGAIISYFDSGSNTVKRLNTSDFSSLPDIPISSSGGYPEAIVVTRDRVITATTDGDLNTYDAATGNLLGVRRGFFPRNTQPSLVSMPGIDTVFAASGGDLYELNASFDSADVLVHRSVAQSIVNLGIVPGTDLVAVQYSSYVDLDEFSDLMTEHSFSAANQQILSMSFAGGNVYLGTPVSSGGGGRVPEGYVTEFNMVSGAQGRSWTFETSTPLDLAVSKDDSTMYVGNREFGPESQAYETFIVKLK
jgi:hypothetical protein